MKMTHEEAVLRKMGVTLDSPDSGCCGMAGAFGFEAGKFPVSQAIGERVLLPAVRAALPDTLIVADGFSCREQIAQATGRRAMHLADVLKDGELLNGPVSSAAPRSSSALSPSSLSTSSVCSPRSGARRPASAGVALILIGDPSVLRRPRTG